MASTNARGVDKTNLDCEETNLKEYLIIIMNGFEVYEFKVYEFKIFRKIF